MVTRKAIQGVSFFLPRIFSSRVLSAALLVLSFAAMMGASFDAEAQRRFGGGRSLGRQSPNVMQQRQAVRPPAAASATTPRNAAAGAASTAKKGGNRFLGPIMGLAAGLGIVALLSHFGLGGALANAVGSFILIALVVFAVMLLLRRLRGATPVTQMGTQGAGTGPVSGLDSIQRRSADSATSSQPWQTRFPAPNTFADTGAANANVSERQVVVKQAVAKQAAAKPLDTHWFIPADFDTHAFLDTAKKQFASIQGLWDKGDVAQLRHYLTDDFLEELRDQILMNRGQTDVTEIVLLNADLLGIEAVAGGHLASVRYSGMLRERAGAEAEHFEEVWNLYKADGQGWLLAGIQQIADKSVH